MARTKSATPTPTLTPEMLASFAHALGFTLTPVTAEPSKGKTRKGKSAKPETPKWLVERAKRKAARREIADANRVALAEAMAKGRPAYDALWAKLTASVK